MVFLPLRCAHPGSNDEAPFSSCKTEMRLLKYRAHGALGDIRKDPGVSTQ